MGVQIYMSVMLECGGLTEIQRPKFILIKFCTRIPTCPRKVLVQFRPWAPHPPVPGGPETLKAEGHIFENCLQNKRCSTGSKLTRLAPDTSTGNI